MFKLFEENNEGQEFGVFRIRSNTYLYIPLKDKNVIRASFNLYSPSNLIKKIYKRIILILILIGFYKVRFIYSKIEEKQISDELSNIMIKLNASSIAIYTGTPCNTQKYTIQFMDQSGKVLGFMKVPLTKSALQTVKNERKNLLMLGKVHFKNTVVPNILFDDPVKNLYVQGTNSDLRDAHLSINDKIIDSIYEILKVNLQEVNFCDSIVYKHLAELVNSDISIYCDLKEITEFLVSNINDTRIILGFSHKDFCQWNIRYFKEYVYVFDWEFSGTSIVYYDIFHFIYFTELLVKRSSHNVIIKRIIESKYVDKFETKLGISYDRKIMFMLYLIELIYQYSTNNEMKEEYVKNNFILMSSLKILYKIYVN